MRQKDARALLLVLCVPEIHASMKEAPSVPAHAATLVAIIGNTA